MTKGDELLTTIRIRNFNPPTANSDPRQRKLVLKEKIENVLKERQISFEEIRTRCQNKPLAIRITFNLLKSGDRGTSEKDLDNLLKILLDVLSINMINDSNDEMMKGLGFTIDDKMIYEIHCEKKIVSNEENMGYILSIYESSFN